MSGPSLRFLNLVRCSTRGTIDSDTCFLSRYSHRIRSFRLTKKSITIKTIIPVLFTNRPSVRRLAIRFKDLGSKIVYKWYLHFILSDYLVDSNNYPRNLVQL